MDKIINFIGAILLAVIAFVFGWSLKAWALTKKKSS